MAKRMVHGDGGGGILKKRIIKRSKRKSIHKLIDYLKSDCYLFAPLISSSPLDSSRALRKGIEIRERTKDNRSLLKKIEDYLKSDCYMYASLVAPQSLRGCVGYVKKVTMEQVSTITSIRRGDELGTESAANMTKEKRICAAEFAEATVLNRQNNMRKKSAVKRSMYPNCRSSSISGEGMRDPKMRKIVVD